MLPNCPKCDNPTEHLKYGAPNESWCSCCDCFVYVKSDGSIVAVDGTKFLVEG